MELLDNKTPRRWYRSVNVGYPKETRLKLFCLREFGRGADSGGSNQLPLHFGGGKLNYIKMCAQFTSNIKLVKSFDNSVQYLVSETEN